MTVETLSHLAKPLQVVPVASGSGARDTGCEAGADVLRSMRLTARLRSRGFRARWAPVIRPAAAYRSDVFESVRRTCLRLARRVERIVQHGEFPIIVGGDHSCAIGTWKGVAHANRERGLLGLLWIDAHMDAHTPQTTESGMLRMIPPTYQMVSRLHPSVGLNPDFVLGMRNHGNALEAMLLYMQDTWNDLALREEVLEALRTNTATQPELVAAGYNSNPARLPLYLRRGGPGWRTLIPRETQM